MKEAGNGEREAVALPLKNPSTIVPIQWQKNFSLHEQKAQVSRGARR
jgi:hypothetical protein